MSAENWPKRHFEMIEDIRLACDVGMRLDLPAREIVERIRGILRRSVAPRETKETPE